MQTSKSGDESVFGALKGSSQRSMRSVEEVFGNITGGASQMMRSIREKITLHDETNTSQENKTGHKSPMDSKKGGKSRIEGGSKQSKRSRMDKSQQSKRGLRSGIVRDGRGPHNRGEDCMYSSLNPYAMYYEFYAGFGDQPVLMEYKSPSLGLQLTEALGDENLADVTVKSQTFC